MVLEMLTGAGLLTAGMALGWWLSARHRPSPVPQGPVCGCGHSLSSHRPDTRYRECGAAMIRAVDNFEVGRVECPCFQYIGPEPLPEYYAPEVSP